MKEELQQLFQSYVTGLSYREIDTLAECYALPCTLTSADQVVVITSEERLNQEVENMTSWIEESGVSSICLVAASYFEQDESTAIAVCEWKFVDQDENTISEFSTLFHIQVSEKRAKIIHVNSHDNQISVDLPHSIDIYEKFGQTHDD